MERDRAEVCAERVHDGSERVWRRGRRRLQQEARRRRSEASDSLDRVLSDRERRDCCIEADAYTLLVSAAHGDLAGNVMEAETREHRGHDPRARVLNQRAAADRIARMLVVLRCRLWRWQHLDAGQRQRPRHRGAARDRRVGKK